MAGWRGWVGEGQRMDGGYSLKGGNHGDQGEYSTGRRPGGREPDGRPAAHGEGTPDHRPPPWDGSNALPPPPQTPTPFCFFFAFGQGPGQAARRPLRPCRGARDGWPGPGRGVKGGRVGGIDVRCGAPQTTEARGVGASAKERTRERDERWGQGRPPRPRGAGSPDPVGRVPPRLTGTGESGEAATTERAVRPGRSTGGPESPA
jgi:hypothetical protein